MTTPFNYSVFTSRNIGFITEAQQEKLRSSKVFIAGTGGMGGIVAQNLVRAGLGELVLAEFDTFELSNLNRQVFANTDTLGQSKLETTLVALKKINPELKIQTYGREWIEKLDDILPQVDVVVNGCDDVIATLALMRAAQIHRKTVIDAFGCPLPNVYVVRPDDRRPEEVFGYPTVGLPLDQIDSTLAKECSYHEVVHVLTHSSSAKHIDMNIAAELFQGTRSRMSFAPMVWMTGVWMSYEAIHAILGVETNVTVRGKFFNPIKGSVENPLPSFFAFFKKSLVKFYLRKLTQSSSTSLRTT